MKKKSIEGKETPKGDSLYHSVYTKRVGFFWGGWGWGMHKCKDYIVHV